MSLGTDETNNWTCNRLDVVGGKYYKVQLMIKQNHRKSNCKVQKLFNEKKHPKTQNFFYQSFTPSSRPNLTLRTDMKILKAQLHSLTNDFNLWIQKHHMQHFIHSLKKTKTSNYINTHLWINIFLYRKLVKPYENQKRQASKKFSKIGFRCDRGCVFVCCSAHPERSCSSYRQVLLYL